MTIMAFDPNRRTNAQAIRDAHELGYINDDEVVLDLTYERGRFWNLWRPEMLSTNDLNPFMDTHFHEDFRRFHSWAEQFEMHFDTFVFDPPYGYRGTSRHKMDEGYGLGEYLSVDEREKMMADGMESISKMMDRGSILLFKMQDQVVSGAKRWQTKMFANLGELLKLRLVDELHVVGFRAQPQRKCQECKGAGEIVTEAGDYGDPYSMTISCPDCGGSGKVDMVQKHAAGNVSTLQIYRKER